LKYLLLKVDRYYSDKFEMFGPEPKGVDWKNREHQLKRFNVLMDIGISSGDRVLDVGCGYGAFYDYMVKKGLKVDYVGVEMVASMVEYAKQRFKNANFLHADFLTLELSEGFDYVLASGTYHVKLDVEEKEWWEKVVKPSIEKMWRLCRKGIAFNMMSPFVDDRYDRLFYPEISEVMDFVSGFTRKFTFRHDYGLFEFTVYLWRD